LVVYTKKVKIDNQKHSDHFENIQSTNWQSLRFKPPTPEQDKIGWRVEFRTMELNFTDFENAAHSCILRLLMIFLFTKKPNNFKIPMSKVDDNMNKALKRDSVLSEKFWFSTDIFSNEKQTDKQISQLSMDQIFNGDDTIGFPGLLYYVKETMNSLQLSESTIELLSKYIKFISLRANGKLKTNSLWIREFVRSHPNYKHDSIVTQSIAYDLMKAITEIQQSGSKEESSLFGTFFTD